MILPSALANWFALTKTPVPLFPLDGRPHLAGVSVPAPDLSAYHAVRTGGGA